MEKPQAGAGNATSSEEDTGAGAERLDNPNEADGSTSYLFHDGNTLRVLRTDSTFQFGESIDRATCGYITSRSVEGIRMVSMSGWRGRKTQDPRVLDGEKYTNLVREASAIMEFRLPADRWDYGGQPPQEENKGRFAACHIEKKLALWWARKTLKAVLRTKDLARLAELREAPVPETMKSAVIYLDHTPCVRFIDTLGRVTGLSFTAKKIPFLEKGTRTKILFVHKGDESEHSSVPALAVSKKTDFGPSNGPEYSSPPKKWIRYEGNVAKPPTGRLTAEEALRLQSPPILRRQQRTRTLEVQLRQITPAQQGQFHRIAESPCHVSPRKEMGISRFRHVPPTKKRQVKKSGRARARETLIRKRSVFARAVQRHLGRTL
ncbi:hypothetical protein OQA88_9266 [Cercophora sp. LCS_1]